jgi:hypothetical protein
MTAIVQPVAGSSGGGGAPNAQNVRGSLVGLAPLGTQTIASVVAGTRKLRGFKVNGSTDGEMWIEVDNVPLAGIRSRFSRVLDGYLVMPNPEVIAAGSVIALLVQNTGPVAGDYEGTIFAE